MTEGGSMRGVRTMARQSPAIVISLMALVFSLGGGAYAATAGNGGHTGGTALASRLEARALAPGRPAAATFRFQNLTLQNGWHTFLADPPADSVVGGVVYLKGMLSQPTAGSGQFARLPVRARPAHTLFIPVSVDLGGGGTVGTLEIFRGGQIAVFSTNPADAKGATSLDGVSFPVNS
jgi:hypothetical protein